MATHKSAIKRAKQNKVKGTRNSGYKSNIKKAVKEVQTAVANNSANEATEGLIRAVSIIQKTASKGIIHQNKAARKISRLSRLVNQITSS